MAETLTPQQRTAVENRGGSLLVSAAAGSGKTKVLVERLFRYVTEEGRNLDDFLIITYTRAAAAELRGKIAAELSRRIASAPADLHLRRQLLRVYQADIKTVDAFCASLLRENTHLLDDGQDRHALTPDFRVLDEDEAALLREGVLRRVLGEFYETLTPAGELLADTLGAGRDDSRLADLVLEVYGKLQSHAYPLRWLDRIRTFWDSLSGTPAEQSGATTLAGDAERAGDAEQPEKAASAGESVREAAEFDATPYAAELLAAICRRAAHAVRVLRSAAARTKEDAALFKSHGAKFLTAADSLEPLSSADTWEAARSAVGLAAFPRIAAPRGRKDDPVVRAVKPLWDAVKASIKDAAALLDVSGAEAMEDLRATAPAMSALLDLTARFADAYRREKLRLNAADFSDQEHLALKLLVSPDGSPSELGRQTAGRYVEILVDEYQDTNEVQNAIFRAVSREGKNLFTVGDVKQSIYRFRLAEPGIFLAKYRRFTPVDQAAAGDDRKLLLSKNFRSRREILDAANFVFSSILSEEMGEMAYGAEEALYFGAAYYPERTDCDTEFHLISAGEDADAEEAAYTGETGSDGAAGAGSNVITVDFQSGRAADGGASGTADSVTSGTADSGAEILRPVKRLTAEARFVAKRIQDLLDEGFPVTDGGELRPCRPEDIVILLRAPGSRTAAFAQALAEQDIPCSFDEAGDFFGSMEVSAVLSLLETADNPRQDVPLISVLRSPLFGFTPDRLAEIRAACPAGDYYDAVQAAADCAKQDKPDNSEEGHLEENNADGGQDGEVSGQNGKHPAEHLEKAKKPPVTEDTARACAQFLAFLSETRLAARDMGVHRLLWRLYNQLNIPGVFGAMDNGEERKENLMVLSRHAERFESGGYRGLFAFVTQLRRLLDADRAPEERTAVGGGVKLMSIHRSKGLEFPIVILADLDHRFSNLDFQTPVLVHPELGLGPRCVDLERRIHYPTLARKALEARIRRENLAEEQRILYVAMTRPKEKLILVDSLNHAKTHLNKLAALSGRPVPPETVAAGRSFGDWLLLALLCRPEAEVLRRFAEAEGGFPDWEQGVDSADGSVQVGRNADGSTQAYKSADGSEQTNRTADGPTADSGDSPADRYTSGAYPWRVFLHHGEAFRNRPEARTEAETRTDGTGEAAFDRDLLAWKYPYEHETAVPAKVTATQLKGRALDDEIAENAARTPYIRPLTQPKFRWKSKGLTPAERGTATHLVLQYLDFSNRDVAGQTAELAARHLLTDEQAAAVDVPALERFLASPLAEEIRRARNVRREYPFTLLVDAQEIDPSAGPGEQVLLQGVVDCCFETDAGLTVVDFKTDRVRDGEGLARRAALYRPQLAAYSRALERVLERPVARRTLFFLETGQAVEI